MTSATFRQVVFSALIIAGSFVGFLLPHAAFAQVWTEDCVVGGGQCHDISDFWIPVTDPNRAYSGMPACVYNGTVANGASCAGYTGPSTCRVNTVVNNEYIYTSVYNCPNGGSGSSCTMVQTSPGSHTLTGYQWVQQANTAYSGTQIYNWPASANACLGTCESYPGSKYCFVQTQLTNYLSDQTYACTAFSDWSSGANMPQQTVWKNGEPYSRTTDDSYKFEPVYAYTDPTYGCQTPTASLSANPVSITRGGSSTLTSSCTNAASASISPTVGSVSTSNSGHSVSPTTSTTYTLTCTDSSGQTATANATISVTNPPITGSCSVSPTSITTGGSATWSASASGGNGSYSYSWTDSNNQFFGTGPTAGHSYSSAGTYGASVTITSGGASVTVNCSNNVTVQNPAQPDLTAGSITPTSATAGSAVTLLSNVKNIGNSTISSGFYTLFQRATDGGGSNTTDLGTFYYSGSPSLPGGGNSINTTYGYAFPSSGTWYVRACADKSSSGNAGVIAESDETNNCGPWTAVTVGSTPPDLTAGSVSPTSATAGVSKTFYATVTNNGQASTGASFSTLFQRATDSSGTSATDLGSTGNGALGGGSSASIGYAYSFPSAGTWYLRACADKSSAGDGGVISESNENNNCGPWTAIAVASPPVNSVSCTVNPSSLSGPGTVTYTASGGVTPYTWNDSMGGSYGTGSTVSRSFSAGSNGNYAMDVTDPTGGHASCPTLVVGNSCSNLAGTITASPTRVRSGGSSTITWNASGVNTTCTVSGPGVSKTDSGNACTVNQDSAVASNITTQSVYTLTCDGTLVNKVIVNVIPAFEEF